MKQLFLLLFLILSVNKIHSQCSVILQSQKLLPYIEYAEYADCIILVEQDSNLNQTLETTLKLVNEYNYMIMFPKIEFDTIVTTSNQIFPKNVYISNFILLFNTFTEEKGLLFVPSFKGLGIVADEKIIDIDDLREIENYMLNVLSQCKLYIKPKPNVLCEPPKTSLSFRFEIALQIR